MPTTSKILEQVSCQACGKSMSAKNLRYAHQKYCTERNKEEQPPEITIPEIEIEDTPPVKNLNDTSEEGQGQSQTTTHRRRTTHPTHPRKQASCPQDWKPHTRVKWI